MQVKNDKISLRNVTILCLKTTLYLVAEVKKESFYEKIIDGIFRSDAGRRTDGIRILRRVIGQ
jgi:hypothetical protein